jgi:glycosyltransferase involved in cell wall biosynthesis
VDAELVVVGDGPYLAAMREELRGHRAVFLGFRHGPELAMCYAGCDLFAFPSTTDTLGQVVMEAQASGLPVLVTDEGGPKEIVRDGVTGRVLRADPGLWAKEIAAMADDGERRGAMGDAAAGFMAGFPFERSFEHWWGVHRDVVDDRGSVAARRPGRE